MNHAPIGVTNEVLATRHGAGEPGAKMQARMQRTHEGFVRENQQNERAAMCRNRGEMSADPHINQASSKPGMGADRYQTSKD